jgi:hypothetical protein
LDECDPPCLDANMQCHLYMAPEVQWLSPFHRSQKFVKKKEGGGLMRSFEFVAVVVGS